MAIKLTIAIPTHNRAALLRETLASIAGLALPEGAAECLVIDNNSTDDTGAVVESFAATAPLHARRIVEPRMGSSFARNRAIEEAAGDFILFIDDDAIADPAWATELIADLEGRQLDATCGAVLPRWEAAPPPWLGSRLRVKLAIHSEQLLTAPPGVAENLHNYFSVNVGFRRTVFSRFGRFREDLGVVGGNPISGEDTELFARIIERGGKMGFAPRARVYHLVSAQRMTRSYLVRKSFAFGMGSAFAGGRSHNHLDKLVRNAVRMGISAMRGDREGVIYHQLECANFFGYWRGRLFGAGR